MIGELVAWRGIRVIGKYDVTVSGRCSRSGTALLVEPQEGETARVAVEDGQKP